ncbi:MAG: glycosyltransferase family 4 protein [Acidobacteria bacterium]|nr:glycosyltransferase family 4 protein [Acidobacteriota bacterium]
MSGPGGRQPAEGLTVPQVLGPAVGGIRAHVAALAPRLESRGVRAPVVGPPGVLGGLGTQRGVVDVPDRPAPLPLLRARRALRPWTTDADVVHAHGLKAAAVVTTGRHRPPLVVTVHNVVLPDGGRVGPRIGSVAATAVLGRADRLVVPSSAVLEGLSPRLHQRCRIVTPVVNAPVVDRPASEVRSAWGIPEDAPLVVSVARLHRQKALGDLLEAWRRVAAELPSARLVLVGDGPERSDLERLAGPGVSFVGAVPDAADELAAADLLVVSSLWEAVPLVLVEALALGVPVVSTRVGIAPAVAATDPTVTVVDVGDVAGLGEAILARLRLGASVLGAPVGDRTTPGLADWCDPDSLVDQVVEVYRELV